MLVDCTRAITGHNTTKQTLSPLVGIFSPSPATTGLTRSTANKPQSGIASVYGGDRTASGRRMKAGGMTAAHRTLPFGTSVTVVNSQNGLAVVVRSRAIRARADYRFEPGGGACDWHRRPCAGIIDGGKWQLARRVLSVAWRGLRGGRSSRRWGNLDFFDADKRLGAICEVRSAGDDQSGTLSDAQEILVTFVSFGWENPE
jgi:hypothetical protein